MSDGELLVALVGGVGALDFGERRVEFVAGDGEGFVVEVEASVEGVVELAAGVVGCVAVERGRVAAALARDLDSALFRITTPDRLIKAVPEPQAHLASRRWQGCDLNACSIRPNQGATFTSASDTTIKGTVDVRYPLEGCDPVSLSPEPPFDQESAMKARSGCLRTVAYNVRWQTASWLPAGLGGFSGKRFMSTDEVQQAAAVIAGMASEFTELARLITQDSHMEPSEILRRLLPVAVAAVSGSEHAGITLITGKSAPRTGASSDDVPPRVDRIQYKTGEGPSLQAAVISDVVLANDLIAASEWPRFARRAVEETGVRSMLCYRLFLNDGNHGALNFYALKPDAFDKSSVAIGAIFAAYTSMAQLAALHSDQTVHLNRALESNREIGVAMGILMANKHLTQDEAFAQLREASQHLHRKLRVIAAEVIYTGALPDPAQSPNHRQ